MGDGWATESVAPVAHDETGPAHLAPAPPSSIESVVLPRPHPHHRRGAGEELAQHGPLLAPSAVVAHLLRARGRGLHEERVDGDALAAHLVVQVRAGGEAAGTHVADHFALPHQ